MLTMHLVKNEDGTPQPFKTVLVHGLVRDDRARRCPSPRATSWTGWTSSTASSSKTLVQKRTSGMMQPKLAKKIEKQTRKHQLADGIASYGTDALRFTFCSLASTGRDIKFDMGRVEGYRDFCNKISKRARYVLDKGEDCGQNRRGLRAVAGGPLDHFAAATHRSRSDPSARPVASRLAAQALYEFIWNQYCDWYLELSKPVLWDENAPVERQRGTRRTLVRVLEVALRLAHPFMPFITEEIWQRIAPLAGIEGKTIMPQPWPVANEERIDPAAENDIEWLKA